MGNKNARPAVAPVSALPASQIFVPPSCDVKKVELNQLNNDVTRKQQEVDSCEPQAAQARKTATAIRAMDAYVAEKTATTNTLMAEYSKNRDLALKMGVALDPMMQYMDTLTEKSNMLEVKETDLKQLERKQRRNFLDNDPQSGVSGPAGIRTSDDKVMFGFWLTYGIAVFMATMVVTRMLGHELKKQLVFSGIALLTSYILAYFMFKYYA